MTTIELCLEDDGTFTIETGEREEVPEQETAEGGNKTTAKDLPSALHIIKKLAEAAALNPPPTENEQTENPTDDTTEQPADDGQETAMMGAYKPRQ